MYGYTYLAVGANESETLQKQADLVGTKPKDVFSGPGRSLGRHDECETMSELVKIGEWEEVWVKKRKRREVVEDSRDEGRDAFRKSGKL